MRMSERIERIKETHYKINKLNQSVKWNKFDEISALSKELQELKKIFLEDIPDYFRFNGKNIDELNQFFDGFTFRNREHPKFHLDILPSHRLVASCEQMWLHLGQVITKEKHEIRFVEEEEINLVYHTLTMYASDEERNAFYKNICSSISYKDTSYNNIETEDHINAIQWTGENYIEIFDFIKPFFYVDYWNLNNNQELLLINDDTKEEFIVPKDHYFIRMSNPLYNTDAMGIQIIFGEKRIEDSEGVYIKSPSKYPYFVYDVISAEEFENTYKKEYEIEEIERD